jgi:hypothetical protein
VIQIRKDMPPPEGVSRGKNPGIFQVEPKYPFAKMQVGDGFELEGPGRYAMANRVRSAARYYSKFHRAEFIIRCTDTGIRCWRTA